MSMHTPNTPLTSPNDNSASPAASASLSNDTSASAISENDLSTGNPIQLLSILVADIVTPSLTTAGHPNPIGLPSHSKSLTIFIAILIAFMGVTFFGVGYLILSERSIPLSVSTIAPLIPVPPISIPSILAAIYLLYHSNTFYFHIF